MSRIVLFSGGSACRAINMALARRPARLTRVVPAWDSGGSSKVIRERFRMLSVGDIRQALMTMAHGEGCDGDIVRICNARLSASLSPEKSRQEFLYYAEGRHPLVQRMEPGLRDAILNYLDTFLAHAGQGFDFSNGSIGNFILTGAWLAHNGDINTAIFVFRKLCGIAGNVWPVSLDNDIVLSAKLRDGRIIAPQDAITALPEADSSIGIADIGLTVQAGNPAAANPAVLEAIAAADLIVFGPGSFYTSILPHLLVEGVVPALQAGRAPRVLIGNILECRETLNHTLQSLVGAAARLWQRQGGEGSPFSHVLANRVLFPFEKTVGAHAYLRDEIAEANMVVTRGEFEDAWHRGQHDGEAVAGALMTLAAPAA